MTTETGRRKLGLTRSELAGKPYAHFWRPEMVVLSERTRAALARGPVAPPLVPSLHEVQQLLEPGHHAIETGLCRGEDGTLRVAILTEMPGVSPEMVDWWFGWHSDEPERYKLWHPQAHVHAEWRVAPDHASGSGRHVGRTSIVDEYLGSTLGRFSIRFMEPADLGLQGPSLSQGGDSIAVCARVGFADFPLDFGYLLHHVRRVSGGAEMRSRFWAGGPHVAARSGHPLGRLAAPVVGAIPRPTMRDGNNLLVHCSQEMAHLASFLPALHAELAGEVHRPALRAV